MQLTSRVGSVAVAAVLAAAGVAAVATDAGGVMRSAGLRAAVAGLPNVEPFDLTVRSNDFLIKKSLQDGTVMQSFGFDSVNKRMYTAQLSQVSGADERGDLTVTQFDLDGRKTGAMYLKGFGHGVSFGVEPYSGGAYLWTETNARVYVGDNGKKTSRGTKLGRFKFVNGGTVGNKSSGLQTFDVPDVENITATIDPVNKLVGARYKSASTGKWRIAVWELADLKAGKYSAKLADVVQPKTKSSSFQGYALYGQFVYLYNGTAYGSDNPAPTGNTYITSVDLAKGGVIHQGPTHSVAGKKLDFREPEGLAVYRKANGEMRLFLGFASGTSGKRKASFFYKIL